MYVKKQTNCVINGNGSTNVQTCENWFVRFYVAKQHSGRPIDADNDQM